MKRVCHRNQAPANSVIPDSSRAAPPIPYQPRRRPTAASDSASVGRSAPAAIRPSTATAVAVAVASSSQPARCAASSYADSMVPRRSRFSMSCGTG